MLRLRPAGLVVVGCAVHTLVCGCLLTAPAREDVVGCATLDIDPANCGSCGHSCLGGGCKAGRCQPVAVAQGVHAWGIAVHDSKIYFTVPGNFPAPGKVQWVPVDRGEPRDVVGKLINPGALVWRTATGESKLVWAWGKMSGGIDELDVGSSQPHSLIVSNLDSRPAGLAFHDDGTLYLSLERDSEQGVTGGVIPTGEIEVLDVGASDPMPCHQVRPKPHGITIDRGVLYWTEGAVAGYEGGNRIMQAIGCDPKTVKEVRGGQVEPGGIATDGEFLYWTTRSDGSIHRVEIGGSEMPVELATSQKGPEGIAVDATSVYWVNAEDDTLMRLAK